MAHAARTPAAAGDSILSFETHLAELGVITHARVNMHPDGGMSRVRLYGLPDPG